jgi:cytochrome c
MPTIFRYSFVLLLNFAHPFIAAGADQPDSFGLGRPVDAAEIAAWDIDVRPDGRGLPEGRGSVAQGAQTFGQKCAFCHGENGVEGPFDVLVGRISDDAFPFGREPGAVKTIGNYWPYATTVFDYINRAMPFNAPGSLEADEVYALVAYLLHRNDIVPADAVLSAENLPRITMPSRHRFVPDDRRGGLEVR